MASSWPSAWRWSRPVSDYRAIPCAQHSEYELLAMRQSPVEIETDDGDIVRGRIVDLRAREGAEYMLVESAKGERVEIRLDRIKACKA